jgi:FlaG/FlaF family flagellin (archaellin)
MPEPTRAVAPVIALAMMFSAITMAVLAALIYMGTLGLPRIVAYVLGFAAFLDFAIGIWFFRKGQSS